MLRRLVVGQTNSKGQALPPAYAPLSAEEEAAVTAEWAANAARPAPEPARDPLAEIDALKAAVLQKGIVSDNDIVTAADKAKLKRA
jgi:hypothetical protein